MAGRGRPKRARDEQAIRMALLVAAADGLSRKPYGLMSIRELADSAGTTSAMVSYYFGGKAGVVTALLESVLAVGDHLLPDLEKMAAGERSRALVSTFFRIAEKYPWLFRLVMDDLLHQQQELRALLLDTVASQSNRLLEDYFQYQIAEGYFRADLDIGFAKISLLSLMVFPLLGESMFSQGFGFKLQTINRDQLIEHIVCLFESSLLRPPESLSCQR